MSYKRAIHILPNDLLEMVQEYVDGEFIYIPRKSGKKKNGVKYIYPHRITAAK